MRFQIKWMEGPQPFEGFVEDDSWAGALKQAQVFTTGPRVLMGIRCVDTTVTMFSSDHRHGTQSPPGGVLDRTAELVERVEMLEQWQRVTEARLNKLEDATRGEF